MQCFRRLTRWWHVFVSLVLLASNFENIFAQNGKVSEQVNAKIQNYIAQNELQKKNLKSNEKKVENYLRKTILKIEDDKKRGGLSNKNEKLDYSTSSVKVNELMQIQVIITLLEGMDSDTSSIIQQIIKQGGHTRLITKASQFSPVELYCWIPYDKILQLTENPAIGNISSIGEPTKRVGSKTSKGDSQLKADRARQYFGKNGGGVKVGVISTGVPHISNSISSFDIPPINNQTHILHAGDPNDDEGTAILEIVSDIAPGADLYFAGIAPGDGPADMANRVNLLRDAGCKIIVDDIGWPYNSPQYSDDYLYNTIYDYRTSLTYNRSYISAAGNDGNKSWSGMFNPDQNNQHLWWYENNEYYSKNYFSLSVGQSVQIILQWADKWNYARSDYDVYLFDMWGTAVDKGDNNQGTNGSIPREVISFDYTTNNQFDYFGPFYIVVKKYNENTPSGEPEKEIRLLIDNPSLYYTYPNYSDTKPSNQIYGKEMAATAAIGAYPSDNSDILEPFTSRGPSKFYSFYSDGVQSGMQQFSTPAVVATDGVETKVGYDGNFSYPFYGTSASAPHVAGIAALYYSKFPTGNFYTALTNSAPSIAGGTGGTYNNQSGFGKADATECLMYSLTSISPGTISSNTNWMDVKISGTVTINSDIVVTVPSGSTSAITGIVNFGNVNSKIIVAAGGTLIVRKTATANPSNITGNVIFENAVTVSQLKEDGGLLSGSTFGRWEGGPSFVPYVVPKYFSTWNINGLENLQANQTIISNQKYNFWKVGEIATSTIVNDQILQVEAGGTYIGQFKTTYSGVTIKANLAEASTIGGAQIDFKDPWLIDLNLGGFKRNQGMSAPFKVRTSPFYPNYSSAYGADVYHGVFLSQPYGGSTPFYSLRAPMSQSLYIPQTGRTHKLYLQNWTATGATLMFGDASDLMGWGYQENPVVFTSSSAVANANYKATQISNLQTAYRNNSQRKTIKPEYGGSGPTIYQTYESMGGVFFEKSTDNGLTWDFENKGKPLNTRAAKSPSLFTSRGKAVLTYQEQSTTNGYTDVKVFNVGIVNNVCNFSLIGSFSVYNPSNLDLNPVTSFYYDFITGGNRENTPDNSQLSSDNPILVRITTVWEEGGGLKLRCGRITNLSDAPSVVWGTTPYTIANAKRASVSADIANNIVWERVYSPTTSDVFHMKYDIMQTSGSDYYIQSYYVNNLSWNSGYTRNYNPSIISISDGARVCWIGYRNISTESVTLAKSEHSSIQEGEYRVVFKDANSSSNMFWHFGSQVASPTITKNDGTPIAYYIGWSENSGQYNKFADNYLSTIRTLNTTGNDVQITNGNTKNDMYAISYKTANTPYYFSRSNNLGSYYAKEQFATVASGREGIIGKGGVNAFFALGDITVDGTPISFIDVEDTVNVTTIAQMNKYLTSQQFSVSPTSKFFYSVSYGIAESEKFKETFNDDDFIKFKVELVDITSDEIIATFDNVNYSKQNVEEYDNIAWEVAAQDLSNKREVILRLSIETNIVPAVSFAEKYADDLAVSSDFAKQHPRKMSVKNSQVVTEYTLSQNYPNPFNPSTTINYALPKSGFVTLKVYDVLGREVVTLVNDYKETGRYSVNLNASKLSSGTYIYKLTADKFSDVKKFVLIK